MEPDGIRGSLLASGNSALHLRRMYAAWATKLTARAARGATARSASACAGSPAGQLDQLSYVARQHDGDALARAMDECSCISDCQQQYIGCECQKGGNGGGKAPPEAYSKPTLATVEPPNATRSNLLTRDVIVRS